MTRPLDEPAFGRMVSGVRVRIDAAIALSTVLGIPPPIFLPATEEESRAIVAEMSLRATVAPKIDAIRGSLQRGDSRRQDDEVTSDGGGQRERRHRRLG